MQIATASYPLTWFRTWSDYEAKLTEWVAGAAGQGAELLVFPEYGAMELVSLAGVDAAAENTASIQAVSNLMGDVNALHRDLARRFGVHILGASAAMNVGGRVVNRAHFHTPQGATEFQDKAIMTLWERDPMGVTGQGPLKVFDTALGVIAVSICYDSEFPLLARAQSAADLLLVPSTTEAEAGYWRVRIAAQARALEGQCIVAMASTVGDFARLPLMETSVGAGGIFAPPDQGFPANGVVALGQLNAPGWTFGDVDLGAVRDLRTDGEVRNHAHWSEADPPGPIERVDLR